MTPTISYFRFYFPEYVLKTWLPPKCATGFLDRVSRGMTCVMPRDFTCRDGSGHSRYCCIRQTMAEIWPRVKVLLGLKVLVPLEK